MSVRIVDRDLGFTKKIEKLKELSNIKITAGIHEDTGFNDGVRVVDYAIWNHYGTKKIPSRPFLSISFDKNNGWYDDIINTQNNIVDKDYNKSIALIKLADKVKRDIQTVIKQGVSPPNAPSTIKKKKSSKTLIDTGVMLSKVNYKIRYEK